MFFDCCGITFVGAGCFAAHDGYHAANYGQRLSLYGLGRNDRRLAVGWYGKGLRQQLTVHREPSR